METKCCHGTLGCHDQGDKHWCNPVQSKQNRSEALELVLTYAKDIVESWPNMTIRNIGNMTTKINALKEALELAKK